jgi:Glu-tRNA(Gln) amidotransferase subunit E-like FAD-binding protein
VTARARRAARQAGLKKDLQGVTSVEITNEYRRVAEALADQFAAVDIEEIISKVELPDFPIQSRQAYAEFPGGALFPLH